MTIVYVLVIVALTLAVFAVAYREYRAKMQGPQDYNQYVSSDEKKAAIQLTNDPDQLREMWEAWEKRGWVEGGIVHATLLARVEDLGGTLSQEEEGIVNRLAGVIERGKALPTIRGWGRMR